jgi:hypothetical protein
MNNPFHAVYYSVTVSWSAGKHHPQIQSDTSIDLHFYDASAVPYREDAFNMIFEKGRKWSKSDPVIGQDINTKFWESHASVSRDGKTMYFTSNRKDGFGEMDLYRTQLQAGGQLGQPVNMGGEINTELNEDTPFITDNDSSGHENGGTFYVKLTKRAMTKPEILNIAHY